MAEAAIRGKMGGRMGRMFFILSYSAHRVMITNFSSAGEKGNSSGGAVFFSFIIAQILLFIYTYI